MRLLILRHYQHPFRLDERALSPYPSCIMWDLNFLIVIGFTAAAAACLAGTKDKDYGGRFVLYLFATTATAIVSLALAELMTGQQILPPK